MAQNTNAKEEFLRHVSTKDVLCCEITVGDYHETNEDEERNTFRLTTGFTKEDMDFFLKQLDFMYDSGYGSQFLFGTIWYKNGTWSDRYEYDGSESWDFKSCPKIPDRLKRIDKEREEKLNQIL